LETPKITRPHKKRGLKTVTDRERNWKVERPSIVVQFERIDPYQGFASAMPPEKGEAIGF